MIYNVPIASFYYHEQLLAGKAEVEDFKITCDSIAFVDSRRVSLL